MISTVRSTPFPRSKLCGCIQKVTQNKNFICYVCLFVCLTGRSVRRHTWVLMGQDSNKMLKPGYKSLYNKHAGLLMTYSPEWYNTSCLFMQRRLRMFRLQPDIFVKGVHASHRMGPTNLIISGDVLCLVHLSYFVYFFSDEENVIFGLYSINLPVLFLHINCPLY